MKILLINPPSRFLIDDNVFPTLGLLYLSAYLKRSGYRDIGLLDLNGNHSLSDDVDADVIGIYSNTPQFPEAVILKNRIKDINKNRKALYVIGGPHVSGKPEDAVEDFDFVVCGEGEKAFLDIVKYADSGNGRPEKIVKYPYIKNIDDIPFPDRDLVDIRGYHYFIDGKLATTVITSRGCPFSCQFCANNAWGKTVRLRSPENVTQEIKELMDKYGYRAFMFFDDTMTLDRPRMERLCDMLKGLGIIFRCFTRADTVDRALLKKMRASGCVEVGMGIESGSQRILDISRKSETVKEQMSVIKMCRETGLRVKGFFIIGLPGEDQGSIGETISFLEEARLDDIDVTIFKPYPGSGIYRNKGLFDINFVDDYEHAWFKGKPGDYQTTVSTKALKAEDILKYRDEIEAKFKDKRKIK